MPRPGLHVLCAMLAVLVPACAAAEPAGAPGRTPALSQAPTSRPMDAAEQRAVIEDLARALETRFVFPDVGARYAARLRERLSAGAYASLSDPETFARQVTADLQQVSADGHLRLDTRQAWQARQQAVTAAAPEALGLEEAKMIGDVAYLRFSLFDDEPAVTQRARRFLLDHADAKAVIIDSRPNHGGGLGVMNAVLPLLYARPAVLVRMDTRAAAAEGALPYSDLYLAPRGSPASLVRADHLVRPDVHEHRLQHVPVYYLISHRSASAAEHLALAFKRTHRATLIGETTRGAGHYGGLDPIGERFAAFIPVGRTYDPDTGWDWEGKGVSPDIVTPADQALDEALRRARASGAHPT
jgi:hypothetical protein